MGRWGAFLCSCVGCCVLAAGGSSRAGETADHQVFFASLDAGPGQTFVSAGLKWSPWTPSDQSGVRILTRAGGAQAEGQPKRAYDGESKKEGYVLLGAEEMTGRGVVGVFFGPEILVSRPRRGRDRPEETQGGLRFQAEIWDRPTPDSLIQLAAAFSTANAQVWSRLALGSQILPPVFVGPESEITARAGYTKWRAGGHLTGLKLWGTDWRLSAGFERATDARRGGYATVSMHWAR